MEAQRAAERRGNQATSATTKLGPTDNAAGYYSPGGNRRLGTTRAEIQEQRVKRYHACNHDFMWIFPSKQRSGYPENRVGYCSGN